MVWRSANRPRSPQSLVSEPTLTVRPDWLENREGQRTRAKTPENTGSSGMPFACVRGCSVVAGTANPPQRTRNPPANPPQPSLPLEVVQQSTSRPRSVGLAHGLSAPFRKCAGVSTDVLPLADGEVRRSNTSANFRARALSRWAMCCATNPTIAATPAPVGMGAGGRQVFWSSARQCRGGAFEVAAVDDALDEKAGSFFCAEGL
jgi:hypothetical protein